MKITLYDKEKTGIAKYCPTFAKAFDCLLDTINKRKKLCQIRDMLKYEQIDQVLAEIKRDHETIILVAKLLFHKNANVQLYSALVLGNAAEVGIDISSAIPALGDALCQKQTIDRLDIIATLRKAAEKGDNETRKLIADAVTAFANKKVSEAGEENLEYKRAVTELIKIMKTIGEAEGVTYLSEAKLARMHRAA